MLHAIKRLTALSAVSALLVMLAVSQPALAGATRGGKDAPEPQPSPAGTPPSRGDGANSNDAPPMPDPSPETTDATPGGAAKDPPRTDGNGPTRPPGGGSAGGLPPAVVVLDILRRLPKWPPARGGEETDEGGGPEPMPEPDPQSSSDTPPPRSSAGAPPKPPRVVAIAANVPFKPKPSPRPQGAPAVTLGATGPEALDREVLVTLGPGADNDTVFALSQDFGLDGQTLYTSALLGTRVVRFRIPDTRSVADVVLQLSADARVAIAAPHYVYTASGGAAKPLPLPQYAPAKLKLSEAHKIASGKRVRVAVIDTGVDAAHPAFKGAQIESFDALGGAKSQPETHGTAIAGIVGARDGLEGVAPQASLLSARAFTAEKGASARSFTFAILKSLDWAVLSGARVVNMSFAGPADPILAKAISAADAQGVVLIGAAGNGGPSAPPAYPAAYPEVVAVTATDDRDGLYKDANRGSYIAIAAPGVDIVAAAPGGAYDISSGTSLAAAHVSGIAALMLERNPKLTSKDVREALRESAHKVSGSKPEETGAGLADAAGALEAVK